MLIFVIILLFIAASFILFVWNDKRYWPSDMVEFISVCTAVYWSRFFRGSADYMFLYQYYS